MQKWIRKTAVAVIYFCLVSFLLIFGYHLELMLNDYRTALDISTNRVETVRKGRDVDFPKLRKQNEDVMAWIWLPDSNIDYPVVQGRDNEYYVNHDLDGSYLYDGCIFIDATVDDPFNDFNTVIYGHRMLSGAMFNNLGRFTDRDYFDSHRKMIIETPDKSYDLHVIAFCAEPSDSDLYTTGFTDDTDPYGGITRRNFVKQIRSRAEIISEESFDETDKFVTLSTCAYASGDARNQVIGILKDAETYERTEIITEEKPLLNKWLILMVIVGAVMTVVLIYPLVAIVRSALLRQ